MKEKLRKTMEGPIGLTIAVFIFMIASTTVGIYFARVPDTAAIYPEDFYYGDKDIYCPGEYIRIEYQAVFEQRDVLAQVAESFWDVENNTAALPGRDHSFFIRTERDIPLANRVAYVLVPNLPVGHYEYRRAITEFFTKPDVFSTPFYVPEGCTTP